MTATLRRNGRFSSLNTHTHGYGCVFCLQLTAALIILQFTKYAHFHFLLVMLVVTLMAYERLAFAELFAEQQSRIGALEDANRA